MKSSMASHQAKNWRVEATVPAIQWVQADTKEQAIEIACANADAWEVDLEAPIEPEHVVDAEAEDAG